LYFVVAISGVVGMVLSRFYARQLTTRGHELIYERIPLIRRSLAADVREIVEARDQSLDQRIIADCHVRYLYPYFARHHNFWSHLFQSERPRQRLLRRIAALRRYVSSHGEARLDDLARYVEWKDELDFQYAIQSFLKYWSVAHVCLVPSMLFLIGVHALFAHLNSGSAG